MQHGWWCRSTILAGSFAVFAFEGTDNTNLKVELLSALELQACLGVQRRAVVWWASFWTKCVRPPQGGEITYPACDVALHAQRGFGYSAFDIYTCAFGDLVRNHALVMVYGQNMTSEEETETLELIQDLAAFSMHVGRRSIRDDLFILYETVRHRLKRIQGMYVQRPLLLSDRKFDEPCPRTEGLIKAIDKSYLDHGIWIRTIDHYLPSFVSSVRGMEALPKARALMNCHDDGFEDYQAPGFVAELCRCLIPGTRVDMGWSVGDADIELFIRLRDVLHAGVRVFAIGNAFGYSTIVLGTLFASEAQGGSVDVIDGETEGLCNFAGSWITRQIVNTSKLDVLLTSGLSPQEVPAAMRFTNYDLAFIDGEHSLAQLSADFAAVAPRLSYKAVVVLHDVSWFDLHDAVEGLPAEWNRHIVRGRQYKNIVGTVMLHRGFVGMFDEF